MKFKKVVLSGVCAAALVVGTVAGTMAWLTDKSEVVTNTFTVGKVEITLDETDVDLYGVKDGDTRVIKNDYKLIPGHTYVKDPTVHFQPGSEKSYLFVKVTGDISGIEAGTTVAAQIEANGWIDLGGSSAGVYYKVVDANTTDKAVDYPVFSSFKLTDDADIDEYNGETIVVTAYAIQFEGMESAADAWENVKDVA